MSNRNYQEMLYEAEKALSARRLGEARKLYEKIQQKTPDNQAAVFGLQQVARLEEVAAQVNEQKEEGDQALASGQYKRAVDIYSVAFNVAGQHGILTYQAELERKRNRAEHLAAWAERIQNTQRQVERLEGERQWSPALSQIDELFQKLPEDDGLQKLAADLTEIRERIYAQIGDGEKHQQASQAFSNQHFLEAIALCENISPDYAQYEDVKEILNKANRLQQHIVGPALDRAEAAFKDERWGAAFAELDKLREDMPKNPEWRQKWLQIGEKYGFQELDAGRKANTGRDFEQAGLHFRNARDMAFSKIIEVYPNYDEALAWKDEADDLTQIAALEHQAQIDWRAGRRPEALNALEEARLIIDRAKQNEGRDYLAVRTTVETMQKAIQDEMERIEAQAIAVKEGERLLKEKRLDEAKKRFEQALNGLEEKTQNEATAGLKRVDTILRQFEANKKASQQTADLRQAVASLEAAYEQWPYGPGVVRLLEQALLKAGQQMLVQGRTREAAEYATRGQDLNGDISAFQGILDQIEWQPKVEARLDKADDNIAAIRRQEQIQAKDFQPVRDDLDSLLAELGATHPKLSQRVETLFNEVVAEQERWRAYENAYRQAGTTRNEGKWSEAADILAKGLSVFGDIPLPIDQELQQWRSVAGIIQERQPRLESLLEEAAAAYAEAAATLNFDQADGILRNAEDVWQDVENSVNSAQGGMPAALSVLHTRMQQLQERVALAQRAFNQPTAREGLVQVQTYINRQGADETLTALQETLTEQVREQLPILLNDADNAEQEGDLTVALDLLRQASALDPLDETLRQRYSRLQQRKQLEDRLQTIDVEYQQKLATNSLEDAISALSKGLNIFLEPTVALPEKAQQILRDLTRIVSRQGKSAFAETDAWEEAQSLLGDLSSVSVEHGMAGRAYSFADLWLKNSRTLALRGVAESTAYIEDKMKAHRAARELAEDDPNDQGAINLFAETKENALKSLNGSANRRIERSQNALAAGEFELAAAEAQRVEEEIYGPIEKEFKDFFTGEKLVAENRDRAAVLLREARQLQEKEARVRPLLETARQQFAANQLAEAQQQLEQLGDISGLPKIEAEVNQLRQQTAAAIIETISQRLNDEITAAQVDLERTATAESLQERLQQLQAFPQQQLQQVAKAERDRYHTTLDALQQRIQEVDQASHWFESGQEAYEKGDFATAARHLQRALDNTPGHNTALRVTVRKLLDDAEKQAAVKQRQIEGLERAQSLLIAGQYHEARQELRHIQQMGEDVTTKLTAAQAGIGLQEARAAYEDGDWQTAQDDLEEALLLAQDNLDAEDILRDLQRLQRRVARLKERMAVDEAEKARLAEEEEAARRQQAEKEAQKQQELNAILAAARRSLTSGDLDAAQEKVVNVLSQNSAHGDALKLQDEIAGRRQAAAMLQEAETAYQDGNYMAAAATVKTILEKIWPDYPQALILRDQIEREQPIIEALQQAEQMAQNGSFAEARQALQKIANAPRQQIEETYAQINRLQLAKAEKLAHMGLFQEARQLIQGVVGADPAELQRVQHIILEEETKIIAPIEQFFLDARYEDALSHSQRALSQASSPDIQQRLENLQAQIVQRRAEKELERCGKQINQAQKTADLDEAITSLEWLLAQEPQPPDNLYRDIRKLRYQALAHRLRRRMGQAESYRQEEQWTEAINLLNNISDEAFDLLPEAGELGRELGKIAHEVTRRLEDIKAERQRQIRAEEEAIGQELLEKAQQLLAQPHSRLDLDRARRLIIEAADLAAFQDNDAVQKLLADADEALDLYDKTEQAIRRSQEQVNLRQYDQAENALRFPHAVSSLFQEKYDQQRDLVRHLRRAAKAQFEEQWSSALDHYATAIALQPNLELLLESDLERCRQHVMNRVITEAQRGLEKIPPDWERVNELLDQAEEANWVSPMFAVSVQRFRKLSASYRRLAEAITLFKSSDNDLSDNDLSEIASALQAARKDFPEEEIDTELIQWERLLDAAAAWVEKEDWKKSLKILSDLDGAAAKLAYTQNLRQKAEAAKQKDLESCRAAEEEAKRVERLRQELADKRQKISTALQEDTHEAYETTLTLLQEALDLDKSHELTIKSVTEARDHLKERIETLRSDDKYGQAIQLSDFIKKIKLDQNDPDNQESLQLINLLPQERQEKLDKQLRRAETALEQYDADAAEEAIERAEIIVEPESRDDLSKLRKRIKTVRERVVRAKERLGDYRQQRSNKRWSEASSSLKEAVDTAAAYSQVREEVEDYQDFLHKQAQEQLDIAATDSRGLVDALRFCELGLMLDSNHAGLAALKREAEQAQREQWQTLLEHIRACLEAWDLSGADHYLNQAVLVFADRALRKEIDIKPRQEILVHEAFAANRFAELRRLDKEWVMKNGRASEIKGHMEAGFNKIHDRDYAAAADDFLNARKAATDFTEARQWQSYANNMAKIIQHVQASEFRSAVNLLQPTESLLRISAITPITSIIDGSTALRYKRRQAVYDVVRLKKTIQEMLTMSDEADQLTAQKDSSSLQQAIALKEDIIEHRKAFNNLYQSRVNPPEDFEPIVARRQSQVTAQTVTELKDAGMEHPEKDAFDIAALDTPGQDEQNGPTAGPELLLTDDRDEVAAAAPAREDEASLPIDQNKADEIRNEDAPDLPASLPGSEELTLNEAEDDKAVIQETLFTSKEETEPDETVVFTEAEIEEPASSPEPSLLTDREEDEEAFSEPALSTDQEKEGGNAFSEPALPTDREKEEEDNAEAETELAPFSRDFLTSYENEFFDQYLPDENEEGA